MMLVPYETFLARLRDLRAAVAQVCTDADHDPADVTILPVTKSHPADAVHYAQRAGLAAVGENRVQEARDKRNSCGELGLRWELIGHLQSNKARLAVATFDRIQSVDSVKLLDVIDRAASELGRVMPILIQVNAGQDPAKFGCDLADAPRLVEHALGRPALRLDGLMTIAPLSDDPEVARRTFEALRDCREVFAGQFRTALAELSMGMTGDWRQAVRAGSTQIRIGTALFGQRS